MVLLLIYAVHTKKKKLISGGWGRGGFNMDLWLVHVYMSLYVSLYTYAFAHV